jgi:hypothetical protein
VLRGQAAEYRPLVVKADVGQGIDRLVIKKSVIHNLVDLSLYHADDVNCRQGVSSDSYNPMLDLIAGSAPCRAVNISSSIKQSWPSSEASNIIGSD